MTRRGRQEKLSRQPSFVEGLVVNGSRLSQTNGAVDVHVAGVEVSMNERINGLDSMLVTPAGPP